MSHAGKLLEQVTVASPCTVDWNTMKGDDRVRFCGQCRLNVYNLSGMKRAEAEALVKGAEGRMCVRLFKRPDGTVLTRDCGFTVRAKKAVRRTLTFAGAALGAFLSLGGFLRWGVPAIYDTEGRHVRHDPELNARPTTGVMICPRPVETPDQGQFMQGDMERVEPKPVETPETK